MTLTTTRDVPLDPSTPATGQPGDGSAAQTRHPLLPMVLRSEWAKANTVRSSYWSVLIAIVAMGLGTVIAAIQAKSGKPIVDPVGLTLGGVLFAQLAVGVLAVLVVTSEYSTGMIRSTFVAVPQRRRVIAAKAAVVAGIALVSGTSASLATFLAGQAILGRHGVSLTAPGALRSVIGVGLYLALIAIFAVGLGTIVRSSVGAIAILFGLLFVLPQILTALPSLHNVAKLLPSTAGQAITHTAVTTTSLAPWTGLALLTVYTAGILAAGLAIVHHRDA
jgi:ABC-2 type transport system permease protein